MSGLAAVLAPAPGAADPLAARAVLRAMPARGAERVDLWSDGLAALGVGRFAWETEPGIAGPAAVARDGRRAAVADAALVHVAALRRDLAAAGARTDADDPASLVLAAYRAWGAECAARLEGDWAFVLWDAERRRLLAARDFMGRRPLFFRADGDGTLVVASTVGGALALPGGDGSVDAVAVAAAAAGLFGDDERTCRRGVRRLRAGARLVAEDGRLRVEPAWRAPSFVPGGDAVLSPDAVEEMRSRLGDAVRERLAPAGPTAVWLSGGRDSTAVYASGRSVAGDAVRAVSMSYPPGDPGREDERVDVVLRRCGGGCRRIDVGDVPLVGARADEPRDEPFVHPFRGWNGALAAAARSVGARVALDGSGGDALFDLSPIRLADLVGHLRWIAAAREWRASGRRLRERRALLRWAVGPALPPALAWRLRRVVDVPAHPYLAPTLPGWIREDFAARHGLRARDAAGAPPRGGLDHASYEMAWQLLHPYASRILAEVSGIALGEGVELRSPLLDERIVRLAATRPAAERRAGREDKRLLRAAMCGLLPDEVLAVRPTRGGVTSGYFDRSLRGAAGDRLDALADAPRLADLGVVEPAALRVAWSRYRERGGAAEGLRLFHTLQCEAWLRALDAGSAPAPSAATVAADLSLQPS